MATTRPAPADDATRPAPEGEREAGGDAPSTLVPDDLPEAERIDHENDVA